MTLTFGESHWDYLPDLVQNYIKDLAAIVVLSGANEGCMQIYPVI